MTTNQIEYAKLLESRRTNLANEELTKTRDSNAHSIALRNATETERHNRAGEAYNIAYLGETQRANKAREHLNELIHEETARSNRAQEDLKYAQNLETQRSNRAQEVETKRSHLASEQELNRSNRAKEQETLRHNKASESLQGVSLSIQSAQVSELRRSNMANELISAQKQAETVRSNLRNEQLKSVQTGETIRSNKAKETETNRSNVAKEAETSRHNYESERLQGTSIALDDYHRTQSEDLTRRGQTIQLVTGLANAASRAYGSYNRNKTKKGDTK